MSVELKTNKWAAEKVGVSVEVIKSVNFTNIEGGYCETCEYSTFGIEVRTTDGRYLTHELDQTPATDLIKQILATEI